MKNKIKIMVKRSRKITKNLINKKLLVHNGKYYEQIAIKKDMVGFKIGSFISTRFSFIYKK